MITPYTVYNILIWRTDKCYICKQFDLVFLLIWKNSHSESDFQIIFSKNNTNNHSFAPFHPIVRENFIGKNIKPEKILNKDGFSDSHIDAEERIFERFRIFRGLRISRGWLSGSSDLTFRQNFKFKTDREIEKSYKAPSISRLNYHLYRGLH